MSELQRLKSLLPPENESWVFIEAAAAIDPPLITLEEIGSDEVEIQIDLEEWDNELHFDISKETIKNPYKMKFGTSFEYLQKAKLIKGEE